MSDKQHAVAALVVGACLLSAGCTGPGSPDPQPQQRSPALAAWESRGKPGAPVELDFTVMGEPQIGLPVSVELSAALASFTTGTLHWALEPDGAIELMSGHREPTKVSVEPGRRIQRTVTLVPRAAGRHYLTVTVFAQVGGAPMTSRVFAVPIQVGPRILEQGAVELDADGIPIKTLKSLEKTES